MVIEPFERLSWYYQSFLRWCRRFHVARRLGYVLSLLALGLGVLTYLGFTREADLGVTSEDVVLFLNLDLGVLLILSVLVTKRLVEVWGKRRQGLAGSRLHVRLVVLLSALTITPTIVMALLSGFFLNAGVQSWFSKRVHTALEQSSAIARAYLGEHTEVIRASVEALRRDLREHLATLINDKENFDHFINRQAELRNLSEAIVFDDTPKVLARSRLTFALEFEFVTAEDLLNASRGVVVLTSDERDRVRALVKIDPELEIYLLVGRILDPQILNRIDDTENALSEYHQLEKNLATIKLKFTLIFSVIALLLLVIAIWFGLSYATHLALPIARLLEATEKVGQGTLTARVLVEDDTSDLGILTKAFNRMTQWIEKQQKDLIEANENINNRHRFIQTVLAGVSAGVLGLDAQKKIEIANQSASDLLQINLQEKIGWLLDDVVPEMKGLFTSLALTNFTQTHITIKRRGYTRTFLVRLVKSQGDDPLGKKHERSSETALSSPEDILGYILTFDDITGLIQAQKSAAWSDVARRIAHEIKNPLTPIQLSTERLRRKYIAQIHEDPETFEKCLDTIIRQVEHMGKMVSEFSSFARMPQATMAEVDLMALCHAVVAFEAPAHPDITLQCIPNGENFHITGDASQLEQVLINLIQNATDAIETRIQRDSGVPGLIRLTLTHQKDSILLCLEDNGIGLPLEGREHLLDPYVTHKAKGTGLGLAIVHRILEDHWAVLKLEDNPQGMGALVCITFSKSPPSGKAQQPL